MHQADVHSRKLIRVILADDHAIFRQSLAELLNDQPDVSVVGEASDGQQVIELTGTKMPDVVIVDLRMPVLSGVDIARRVRSLFPAVKVLILSAFDDDQQVISAFRAGADGYMLKSATASESIEAIRRVVAGDLALDPSIDRRLLANQPTASTSSASDESPP